MKILKYSIDGGFSTMTKLGNTFVNDNSKSTALKR